jgi:hypothetical protein
MAANLYKERDLGSEAERIIKSEVYQEAWNAYRLRVLELMEAAGSHDTATVMHLKQLLTVATAVRAHLERIMKEGAIAAASIEFEEKRGMLKRMAQRIAS